MGTGAESSVKDERSSVEMQFWWGFAFAIQGSEELWLSPESRAGDCGDGLCCSSPCTPRDSSSQILPSLEQQSPDSSKRSPYQGMRSGKGLSEKNPSHGLSAT